MTTVSEMPAVELSTLETARMPDESPASAASVWAVELPRARRPSPLTLAALGVLAGIAAMVLGGAAVISASRASEIPSAGGVAPRAPTGDPSATVPVVERRALALLAKPSTERVAFRGAPGLVLAVGSGGRAAILVRGLEPAPAGKPYVAWVLRPGLPPQRAASFLGTERAVFLSRPLGPRASVVVATGRPAPGPAARAAVALRG